MLHSVLRSFSFLVYKGVRDSISNLIAIKLVRDSLWCVFGAHILG